MKLDRLHSIVREEIEAEGKYPPQTLFNAETVQAVVERLKSELHAPYIGFNTSTLGGETHISILGKVSLDPKYTWANGIVENSRWALISIDNDGTVEAPYGSFGISWDARKAGAPKFRKMTVRSVDELIAKLNAFFAKVEAFFSQRPAITENRTMKQKRLIQIVKE